MKHLDELKAKAKIEMAKMPEVETQPEAAKTPAAPAK